MSEPLSSPRLPRYNAFGGELRDDVPDSHAYFTKYDVARDEIERLTAENSMLRHQLKASDQTLEHERRLKRTADQASAAPRSRRTYIDAMKAYAAEWNWPELAALADRLQSETGAKATGGEIAVRPHLVGTESHLAFETEGMQLCTCRDGARYRFIRQGEDELTSAQEESFAAMWQDIWEKGCWRERMDKRIDEAMQQAKASGEAS